MDKKLKNSIVYAIIIIPAWIFLFTYSWKLALAILLIMTINGLQLKDEMETYEKRI
jgi:hypothetical protein